LIKEGHYIGETPAACKDHIIARTTLEAMGKTIADHHAAIRPRNKGQAA
jgi:hypothetical protein